MVIGALVSFKLISDVHKVCSLGSNKDATNNNVKSMVNTAKRVGILMI